MRSLLLLKENCVSLLLVKRRLKNSFLGFELFMNTKSKKNSTMENDLLKALTEVFESKGYSGKEAVEKAEAELERCRQHEPVKLQLRQQPAVGR
jgi:hypothetical protein